MLLNDQTRLDAVSTSVSDYDEEFFGSGGLARLRQRLMNGFRVGLGMKPPTYLRQGDVVALGIDGLGTSRQEVTAWKQRNYICP